MGKHDDEYLVKKAKKNAEQGVGFAYTWPSFEKEEVKAAARQAYEERRGQVELQDRANELQRETLREHREEMQRTSESADRSSSDEDYTPTHSDHSSPSPLSPKHTDDLSLLQCIGLAILISILVAIGCGIYKQTGSAPTVRDSHGSVSDSMEARVTSEPIYQSPNNFASNSDDAQVAKPSVNLVPQTAVKSLEQPPLRPRVIRLPDTTPTPPPPLIVHVARVRNRTPFTVPFQVWNDNAGWENYSIRPGDTWNVWRKDKVRIRWDAAPQGARMLNRHLSLNALEILNRDPSQFEVDTSPASYFVVLRNGDVGMASH